MTTHLSVEITEVQLEKLIQIDDLAVHGAIYINSPCLHLISGPNSLSGKL